jgi:DMSO/TMAO reductase YedYZ heme-binding membrane subunit
MLDLISVLGAVTLLLLIMTVIFQMMFRIKKRKVYYGLHRLFGVITFILAVVHGIIAVLYYYGII